MTIVSNRAALNIPPAASCAPFRPRPEVAGRAARAAGHRQGLGRQVLDGWTLAVQPGEALGIIGPNGAGKTTAMNVIIGRLRPDGGTVLLDGHDVTALAPHARCRAGMALTHQIPHPFEAMSVYENVLVGAAYGRGLSEREARAGALEALALAGLGDKADARAGTLTLVERKRLERAALATAPRVLLLDEIAGGLGEAEIQEIVRVIGAVRARGVAIVWIEHIARAAPWWTA